MNKRKSEKKGIKDLVIASIMVQLQSKTKKNYNNSNIKI